MSERTVAFLTPAAGVWPHALAELPLMESLARLGNTVLALRCSGILSRQCTVMHSKRIGAKAPLLTRRATCFDCRICDSARRRTKGVEWLDLDSLVTEAQVDAIRHRVNSLSLEEVETLTVMGIPLGKVAAYETLLHAKARPWDAIKSNWTSYLGDLQASWITLEALAALADERSIDCLVVFNGLYSSNRSAWEFALSRDMRVVDIQTISHPTQGHEYLRVEEKLRPRFSGKQAQRWLSVRTTPLDHEEVHFAETYILGGIGSIAAWSYSPARSRQTRERVLNRLSLLGDRPVVAILLNSLDERLAATFVGVNTDVSWSLDGDTPIERFIDTAMEVARRRPEWQFVVRIHPRMAAGKRDDISSPELGPLRRRLDTVPSNVVIDWPEMGLSLFDVAIISDAALSIGTTAGLQFMGLGIPTILCDREQDWTFAPDLYFPTGGEGAAEIEEAIAEAIASGPSLDIVRTAFRFVVFKHLRSAHRVRHGVTASHPRDDRQEKDASELRKPAPAWKRQVRRLSAKDPSGIASSALIVTNGWAHARDREREVAETLLPSRDLTGLTDAVLGCPEGEALDVRSAPAGLENADAVAEDDLLSRSLERIFTALGVSAPDWIRRGTR